MDWTIVEENWDQYRAKAKARWGRLSAAHLDGIAGDRMRLASAVHEVYGISSAEVEGQIKSFEERIKDYRPENSSCSKWRRAVVGSADKQAAINSRSRDATL